MYNPLARRRLADRGGTAMENIGNGVKAANRTMQLRVLLSYHYYRDTDLFELFGKYFAKPWPDVFLDSGAFSAKTQGAEIDIGAYAEWLKHHESLATVYANLDVIGNAEGTARNQRGLERLGLRPLPVFHTGEPWITLEDLCAEYQYIALGGMVGVRDKKALKAWIAKCFSIAGDRAVFHGFGLTAWGLMKAFRWYSVDSTTWAVGAKYYNTLTFDPLNGLKQTNISDAKGLWQARHGYRHDQGLPSRHERGRRASEKLMRAGVRAMLDAQAWLEAIGNGTRVYLASGGDNQLGVLGDACNISL